MNKKKRERIIAAVVVLAFELAVTALITVAVGVVLVPMVEAQRGYNAMGGEWVFLMAVAIAAYNALHSYIFRAAYKRKGGRDYGRRRITKTDREISGHRVAADSLGGGKRKRAAKTGMDFVA